MTVRYLKSIKQVQGIYPSPAFLADTAATRLRPTAGFNQPGSVLDTALGIRNRVAPLFNGVGTNSNMTHIKSEPNSMLSQFHPFFAAGLPAKNYTPQHLMKIIKRGSRPQIPGQFPVSSSKKSPSSSSAESSNIPKNNPNKSESESEEADVDPDHPIIESDTSDYDSTADNIFRPYML